MNKWLLALWLWLPALAANPPTLDACALLTPGEAAQFVPQARSSPAVDQNNKTYMCFWQPPKDTLPMLEVAVVLEGVVTDQEAVRFAWRYEAKEHPGRYVGDLGDGAVVTSRDAGPGRTEVKVLLGRAVLKLQLDLKGDVKAAQAQQEALLALARKVTARLRLPK
ncbi:MAG: hypothetical protein C4331_17305 [Meiothermus sp.]